MAKPQLFDSVLHLRFKRTNNLTRAFRNSYYQQMPRSKKNTQITHPFGRLMSPSFKVSGISVSGYISFDIANAAGADITEALNKWEADTPNSMYAANTLPAMVANPPVIIA